MHLPKCSEKLEYISRFILERLSSGFTVSLTFFMGYSFHAFAA